MKLIDKDELIDEINKRLSICNKVALDLRNTENKDYYQGKAESYKETLDMINTLDVKDPYDECVQYDSIEAAIKSHAETYSFNIGSALFNQLTKEQQELWHKDIEEACINGCDAGYSLAKDIRYKENGEAKNVYFEKEINEWIENNSVDGYCRADITETAEYFYERGLKAKEK